jgi:hypothetical protein
VKTLADLDYDELHARAVEAARLPALDDDGDDYAGLDVVDGETRSGYGDIAVTSDVWLRERANRFLQGLPDAPRPVDALRRLDDETLGLVLLTAVYEICLEQPHLRAFNPDSHKRWPKGHPLAGKFRPMIDMLKQAILDFDPKKDRQPFELFKRPQLLKAARDLGVKLNRGEDEDSIAAKLLAHLNGPTAKAPAAPAVPARKVAATAKKTTAAVKKVAALAGPDDGLDKLDAHRLRSLALEYDVIDPGVQTTKTRDEIIDELRALGAVAPDVRFRRIDEMKSLLTRLKNLGRREPADNGPLDRAVAELADGTDAKVVAKQLRKEADGITRKEDADTLRFLAADLVKKKKEALPFLTDKGRIDLVKMAEHHGVDIRRWMPLDKVPRQGTAMFDYERDNLFDGYFRRFKENIGDGTPPMAKARAVRLAREQVALLRNNHANAVTGQSAWAWQSKTGSRKRMIDDGLDAAADLERLADLAEATKLPPAKRPVTLGATSLGEVVPVDESRFRARPLKDVLRHRGEIVPDGFAHRGSGTELVRLPKPPLRPGLSDAENRALDLYTVGVVADGINGSLRKGRNVHGEVKSPIGKVDLDQISRDLDSAIAGSQLTQDTVLWRGTVVSQADYRRLVPGAVYSDPAYKSMAFEELGARQTIAWRQSNGTIPPGRKPVLFKILAPAGTNVALGHERVKEAVGPREMEYRLVRVDESSSPPIAIMEVIPPQREAGVVKGRSIVDDFDYDGAVSDAPHNIVGSGLGGGKADEWLGAIRKAQGFDGKPKVVTKLEMDDAVHSGATQVFRAVKPTGGKTPAQLTEEYRSGDLFPGTGVYGAGTYVSPQRETAKKYGDEATMLRIALRRDARVISYPDLLKLRPRTGITASAAKLADERQAELKKVDPTDTAAIKAILEKYEVLSSRQGSRSRIAGDIGRVAALLGYDAIYIPGDYRGAGSKSDGQTEYVILNRTATIVEEAQP